MKEAPLLIRWGIPGTIFFGVFFFFVGFDKFWCQLYYDNIYNNTIIDVNYHSLIYRMHMNDQFKDYSLVGVIAFLVTASIPLGFIISQLYYFGFWAHFPFRTRRNASKILSENKIKSLWKTYHIKELVQTETTHDNARWRETVPTYILSILYIIMYLVHYLIILPITFLLNLPIKLFNIFRKENNKILLFKRKYTLITPVKVKEAHYEWVALDWHCIQKATPEEYERLESLGHIFHGIGSTFIATILSWGTFAFLHTYLPIKKSDATQFVVLDSEVIWITLGMLIFLFFILWQNRKDVARHQLLIMRALYDRHSPNRRKVVRKNFQKDESGELERINKIVH